MANCDHVFVLWVAAQGRRSEFRKRRGKMGCSILNDLDHDLVKRRYEEAHVTEVGEYGQCFLHDFDSDENKIPGCIFVEICGGWDEGHLTRSGGERRWICIIFYHIRIRIRI